MKIRANGLDLEVVDSATANPDHLERPAVLLVMGLGLQLIDWPESLVDGLTGAGFRVVTFDNRDIGLSSHLDHLGQPNLLWSWMQYRLGMAPKTPYTLADMTLDAIGVLDALQIGQAHIVGMSMGGMIAQRIAATAQTRTLSLTSIMSSSGARGLPGPDRAVLSGMMKRPPRGDEAAVQQFVELFQLIGSTKDPMPIDQLRQRVRRNVARSRHPAGVLRQMVAVGADLRRAPLLSRITAPTLVVHGQADRLVPLACGQDTARRIAGAQLLVIEGMGHDLPDAHVQTLLQRLLPHLRSASAPKAAPSNMEPAA